MTLEFFIIFVSTEVVKFLGMKNQALLKRNIRCPYHSWVYNFDGSLYKAPHLDVDITDKRFHLNKVNSETWGGFIFINLDKKPSSFKKYIKNISDQFIRYPLNELVSSRSYQYVVSANWKVILGKLQ